MKIKTFLKVSLLFLSLGISSMNANARSGDGWSSSGGGEYIIDQDNPWFLGKEAIKWCVSHGGEANFSLSADLAKIEIEKGILRMLNQVKSINLHESDLFMNPRVEYYYNRKYIMSKYDNGKNIRWGSLISRLGDSSKDLLLSDSIEYVDNCLNAELEIILGNINDEKVKKLIDDLGEMQFRRMAGVAIRTSYSKEKLRGKGFIYIAADKGALKYSGEQAVHFSKAENFWSFHTKLSDKLAMPPGIYTPTFNFGNYAEVERKFKESIVSTLQGVVAHEFGHILGLKHNNLKDVMDVDYPAEVIKNGVIFIGNFIRDASVIADAMIEENMDRRIVFEHETCQFSARCDDLNFEKYYEKTNSHLGKMISKALFSSKELEKMGNPESIYSLFYAFDGTFDTSLDIIDYDNKIMNFPYRGDFKIFAINPITLKYVERIKYPVKFAFCDYNSVYQKINVRVENIHNNVFRYDLDEITQEWKKADRKDYVEVQTLDLLTLGSRNVCGEIDLGFRKKMKFDILIDNANKRYEIQFYSVDSTNSKPVRVEVIKSHFANTFKYGIPEPRPEYYFVSPEQR